MTRNLITIILALLLAFLFIWWTSYLDRVVGDMTGYTGAIYEAAMDGDNEEAMNLARRLNEYWDNESATMHALVDHTLVESVKTLIDDCLMLAYTESDELPMKAMELDKRMKHIKDSEYISFANIF
ncbi:MAG: DUF4363 family protein [Christensenellales bacterium]|jgi:hypothetical protein